MSQELRRLVKNFLSLATGVFLARLLNVIATLYIARALGPTDYGTLSFGVSLAVVFSVCVNLGLDDLIVRQVARKVEGVAYLLGDAFILKSLAFPLAALVLLLLLVYDPDHGLLFLFLVAYSLLHSYLLVICGVFRGLERMEFQMLLLGSQMSLIAAGSVLAVHLTGNVTLVALCYLLFPAVVLAGAYVLLLKKGIQPRYRWHPPSWKALIFTTLPFGLTFIGLLLYERLISVLVVALAGETAGGWFNAVYNIMLILALLPSIVAATVFPLLARRAQGSPRVVLAISVNLVKYVSVAGLGLAIVLYTLAPSIVTIFFGPDYQPSILILQILSTSVPFIFLNLTLVGVLEALGWQRACASSLGYALLVAVPFDLLAIWLGGYQGAALAYVVNHVVLTGVMLRLATRAIGRLGVRQVFALPAVAGVLGVIVVYVGRHWSPGVLVTVLGGCFLGVLVLSFVLSPKPVFGTLSSD